jgi:hypothetical protein
MILEMLITSPESEKTRLRFLSSHLTHLNQVKQVATDTAATLEATNLLFRKKNRDEKFQRFAEEFTLALQETKQLTEDELEYTLSFFTFFSHSFIHFILPSFVSFRSFCGEQINDICYFSQKIEATTS